MFPWSGQGRSRFRGKSRFRLYKRRHGPASGAAFLRSLQARTSRNTNGDKKDAYPSRRSAPRWRRAEGRPAAPHFTAGPTSRKSPENAG